MPRDEATVLDILKAARLADEKTEAASTWTFLD